MRKFLLILFTLTFAITGFKDHEFYVSITEMNVKSDTLQMSIKVFTHDLEEVLKDETGTTVFLDNTSDSDKAFRVIRDYCSKNLVVSNAGKKYSIQWVGHEYEADVTWIYAYAIINPESSLLFVRNTLLTTDKRNQHNMIHFTHNNETRSSICTAEDPEVRFSL